MVPPFFLYLDPQEIQVEVEALLEYLGDRRMDFQSQKIL